MSAIFPSVGAALGAGCLYALSVKASAMGRHLP
jgi:hypothetical protein